MDDGAKLERLRALARQAADEGGAERRADCPDEEALDGFAAGSLAETRHEEVLEHLADCGRCSRYVALAARAERPLDAPALAALGEVARQGLGGARVGWWERLRAWVWPGLGALVAATAALLLVVGGGASTAPVTPLAVEMAVLGAEARTQGEPAPEAPAEARRYTASSRLRVELRAPSVPPGHVARAWVLDGAGEVRAACPSEACSVRERASGFTVEAPAGGLFGEAGGYRLVVVVGPEEGAREVEAALRGAGGVDRAAEVLKVSRVAWSSTVELVYSP